MIAGDKVRVQTFVQVPIQTCFDIFTLELDAWWRRGRAYRVGGPHEGALHLEPKLGGRVYQEYGARGALVHEIGLITVWEPPERFAFTWRGINFEPSDPVTTVEVWFQPGSGGTRVTLEHRGFAALREDHPVRHGATTVEFIGAMGRWWGSLATALRVYAESKASLSV